MKLRTTRKINQAVKDAEANGKNLYVRHSTGEVQRVFGCRSFNGYLQLNVSIGYVYFNPNSTEFYEN